MTAIATRARTSPLSGSKLDPVHTDSAQQSSARPLESWLCDAREKADKDPACVEALLIKGMEFLERHLRDRLEIPHGTEVLVGFDPANTRPRDFKGKVSSSARNLPAHGLPDSISLSDLHPVCQGTTSMKTILLYEHPTHRVEQGWSSLVTATVEYIHDKWCVTSVLIWGAQETHQAKARDLFLPTRALEQSEMNQHPAYRNALEVDFPAPPPLRSTERLRSR